MGSTSGNEQNTDSPSSQEPQKSSRIEPIRLPTAEEVRGQDIWNNCAVRSVVSGVMGIDSFPFFFLLNFTLFFSGFSFSYCTIDCCRERNLLLGVMEVYIAGLDSV